MASAWPLGTMTQCGSQLELNYGQRPYFTHMITPVAPSQYKQAFKAFKSPIKNHIKLNSDPLPIKCSMHAKDISNG